MRTPPFHPKQAVVLHTPVDWSDMYFKGEHLTVIACYLDQERWWVHVVNSTGYESHLLADRFSALSQIRRP